MWKLSHGAAIIMPSVLASTLLRQFLGNTGSRGRASITRGMRKFISLLHQASHFCFASLFKYVAVTNLKAF